MPNESPSFVTCHCQHCDGHIEFNGSVLQKGETRNIECPHCHSETKIFVPVQSGIPKPSATAAPAPKLKPSQDELFSIKVSSRAAAIFFAATTVCLALILVHAEVALGREENALAREEKANAVLSAQLQQEEKADAALQAQIRQLQSSLNARNDQSQPVQALPQRQQTFPQTIIVRPESQGQHWQHMGLVP